MIQYYFMWQQLAAGLKKGDISALARSISYVENEQPGYIDLLATLPQNVTAQIIGITGPPGAGKSTVVDGLIEPIINEGKKVAVLCVDPSSPFNRGAVLGDRIRMSAWYTHPQVFIRSLATRGSLGGLHPKVIEITELLKAVDFGYIIVETVGVGQSEVEIAGLADVTVVVVVPESGDEVQTMKAGLMEIADIFVVNKSDRPDADLFVKNLRLMLAPVFRTHSAEPPIIKCIATQKVGLTELFREIKACSANENSDHYSWLLTERAYHLIQQYRMKDLEKQELKKVLAVAAQQPDFNLYRFIQENYFKKNRIDRNA